MTIQWLVPDLNADFSEDFEDLLIDYIYQKWSITDPAKGTTMRPDNLTEPDRVSFHAGFPDYHRPYEITTLKTVTGPTEPPELGKSRFFFATTVLVSLRMKRIERDTIEVDPQLGNMEREVERLVATYHPHDPQDIPGIKDLYFDFPLTVQRIYDARDNYAKSDWRSVISIKMFYEKQVLV